MVAATQITPALVLAELQHHIGKANGIHVRELAQRITGELLDADVQQRRIRHVVTELRMQGHHVCATPSEGYYIAADADELNETCSFLYDRAMTGLTQVSRMKNIALPDLRGQLHLPT